LTHNQNAKSNDYAVKKIVTNDQSDEERAENEMNIHSKLHNYNIVDFKVGWISSQGNYFLNKLCSLLCEFISMPNVQSPLF
jgi:hypothetical protein